MDASYHFSFSLGVVGESGVGKSALVSCTQPDVDHYPTAGDDALADHGVRTRSHTYESRGAKYQITMWEVPGAPRYLNTVSRYAAMAAGAAVVFDLSRRATFERAELWLEKLDETSPGMPRVLLGNKSDLPADVEPEEALQLAKKYSCKYFETCTTQNEQVPEAFSTLIAGVVSQIPNPPEPSLLLRKRIQIGRALAENKSFRAALFGMEAP